MATSVLTPLQLTTGASLLQNSGLGVSANLAIAETNYSSTSLMTAYFSVLSASANVGNVGNIYANTVSTLTSNTVPAFSDSVPYAYHSLGKQMIPTINSQASHDAGSGDISKFVQALNLCQSYAENTNLFINSAVNSQTYLANTFTSTNAMITGDITKVNLATQAFGSDLANLGRLIDLSNLGDLGSPLNLVQRIISLTGNIPVVSIAFLVAGVPQDVILNLTSPTVNVTDSIQKLMYQAMTTITGSDLAQILKVLHITTPNINTMADLLNPVKLFPNSYQSLTVTTSNGPVAIYIDSAGSVNSTLTNVLPAYVLSATGFVSS